MIVGSLEEPIVVATSLTSVVRLELLDDCDDKERALDTMLAEVEGGKLEDVCDAVLELGLADVGTDVPFLISKAVCAWMTEHE